MIKVLSFCQGTERQISHPWVNFAPFWFGPILRKLDSQIFDGSDEQESSD